MAFLRQHPLLALLALFICGSLLTALLGFWHIPAAAFLGYLVAGIFFGISGSSAQVPPVIFRLGQACLGLLIANWVTPASVAVILSDWPLMLMGLCTTLVSSVLIAWLLIRLAKLSPLAAAWGCAPGAASAVVASAALAGADSRMVATLQYLRILAAILTATVVSHWLPATPEPLSIPTVALTPSVAAFLAALGVVALGVVAGAKIPNGANLIPLVIGVGLNAWHPGFLYLPSAVSVVAFAAIGMHIGLRFDRATLWHIGRQLPVLLLAVFALTILCCLWAALLAWGLGRDFGELFYALSPGGLDAMAIMALESGSPLPLVLAMQTLRILLVVLLGGQLVKCVLWLSARASRTS